MSARVIKPGLLTSVQDLGRYGHSDLGVGHSGPMDVSSSRLANALVGNAPQCGVLEVTLLGPTLQFDRDALIAVTGARMSMQVDGVSIPLWRPVFLPAGSVFRMQGMALGARSYLAIAGGWLTRSMLQSVSVDINAGIGRPLQMDDELPFGPCAPPPWLGARKALAWPPWSLAMDRGERAADLPFRIVKGAHFSALTERSQQQIVSQAFELAVDSNRVGYRLSGCALSLQQPLELISEAVDFGTMQLPPSGAPIILMAEHPTTGGYPRIAQVIAADLSRLGQCRPGDALRFSAVTVAQAQQAYAEHERRLHALIDTIGRRLASKDQ